MSFEKLIQVPSGSSLYNEININIIYHRYNKLRVEKIKFLWTWEIKKKKKEENSIHLFKIINRNEKKKNSS